MTPAGATVRVPLARGRRLLGLSLVLAVLAPVASAHAAECAGDECQGPPPAPEEVIPGTAVVDGPPNPPVHYPKERGGNKDKAKKKAKKKSRKQRNGKRHRDDRGERR